MATPAVLSRRAAPPPAHPAAGILRIRRITQRRVADALSVDVWSVSRMLNGQQPATPRFRRGLAALLGLSEEELFETSGAGSP